MDLTHSRSRSAYKKSRHESKRSRKRSRSHERSRSGKHSKNRPSKSKKRSRSESSSSSDGSGNSSRVSSHSKQFHDDSKKVIKVERLAEMEKQRKNRELQQEVISDAVNKRIEALVNKRVEEELEKRKEKIKEEVTRRIEEVKKEMKRREDAFKKELKTLSDENRTVKREMKRREDAFKKELKTLSDENRTSRTYIAGVYVGEYASNVAKALKKLSSAQQDQLYADCGMDAPTIRRFKEELGVLSETRHHFAHLGDKDDAKDKIQHFSHETLKKGIRDMESSDQEKVSYNLQKIDLNSSNSVFRLH